MRQIREILRLRWQEGLTIRQTATSVGRSVGGVQKTVERATKAGLDWTTVEGLDEAALEARLYQSPMVASHEKARPDPVYLHRELKRVGVTLQLLHLEYLEQHPDGLRYTAFCEVYRHWHRTVGLVMRQTHKAGEKTFVDYSGKKPHCVDPSTGELIEVELFVAVLGASNYTYAVATLTQQVPDFIAAHVLAYQYFQGVTAITVTRPAQVGRDASVSVRARYAANIDGDSLAKRGSALPRLLQLAELLLSLLVRGDGYGTATTGSGSRVLVAKAASPALFRIELDGSSELEGLHLPSWTGDRFASKIELEVALGEQAGLCSVTPPRFREYFTSACYNLVHERAVHVSAIDVQFLDA